MFVDIEPDTANIDPNPIEDAITPRTKAILPVDAFGQPARLDVIREIADRHGLVVIEDSCWGGRGRDDRHRRRPVA